MKVDAVDHQSRPTMVITMVARWLRVEHKRSTEKAARSKGVLGSRGVRGWYHITQGDEIMMG